ncbi:MAG: segregation/condensation protein A [Cytophagales bacterium]|nr:segregation/condensation protein A [Bernardetiaceae bacterium]MDW8209779.1 segregation/condensation protein A [Cytophagales bacterium]
MQIVQSDTFSIKLPLFEGPFDLLLFFIERDELDICDIPIAKITADFLDYLHQLEQVNMELASEFMVVAATLMRIKARMLLPRSCSEESPKEQDPRQELVEHLLEYKKYKAVAAELTQRQQMRLSMVTRGNLTTELQRIARLQKVEAELYRLNLYKLLRTYERLMKRFAIQQRQLVHQIIPYSYTIEKQKELICLWIEQTGCLPFTELIARQPQKIAVIFNFLAILELLQNGQIAILLGEGYNNFVLIKP